MNKKVNTLLFILCATLFNIIIALVSFIVFALIYLKIFMLIPESSSSQWPLAVIFLASIGVSFLVYRIVLKHLIGKVDIEKYFDPLFVGKYKGKK